MAKVVPVDNDEELSRSSDVSGVRQVSTTAGASDNDVALVDTYRNSDSDLLDTALRVLGGTRKGVAGDGACQFAAVAAQLDGVSAVTLRKAVVADMERTPPSEADIRAVGGNSPETLETYMAKMRRTDYYGDDLTLVRMCFLQNISVCILSVSEKGCLSLLRHEHGPRYVFLTYRPEHYDRLEAPQHVLTEIVENQPRVQDVLSLVKQGSRPSTAALERENFRASGNGSRHALPEMTSTDGTSESGGESRAPATPRRKPETSPTSEVSTEAEEMPPPPAVILRDETHTPSVSAQQLVLCLEREVDMTIVHYAVLPYLFFLPLFTVYMGFMYMSDKDDGMYHMNTALRKNLMEDEMFKEIDTHDDFYAWLQSTAKNFWVTKDEYDRAVAVRGNASSLSLTRTQLVGINRVQAGNGLFAERQNYPLHFMMLRQKRVEMQPCGSRSQDQAGALHPEVWRRIENTCIDKLSRSDREADPLRNVSRSFPHVNDSTRSVPYPDITTDPFVTDGKKEPQLPPMRSSWSSFLGRTYYHYSGDKKLYSAKLPYQELFLGDVEKIVSDLKANDWIDFTTRVVVVEAIVYNAVRHQYVLLHYVVEFTHSGHVTSFSTSDPFWLLFRNSGGWHSFVFACDIILVFFVVLGFGEWVWKARLSWMMGKHPIKVLGDDWKYLQVLQLGFTIACLVFRFRLWARSESLSLSTAEWENVVRGDSDVYADLLSYQAVFEMAKGWSALSFLLALGRFYEYIRYSGLLRSRLTETLSLAARNLFRILLFTFLVSLAFGLVANVIYGSHMREFRTIQVSFERLLRMLNEGGFDTYDEMRELDPLWTPFFFLVYLITAWLILLNVVLAVLAAGFSAAQSPKTGYSGVREAVTHVVKRRKRPMSDYALCCRLLRHHVSRKRNKYYDANEKQLGNVFDDRTVKVVLGEVLKLTTELPRCCGVFSCASPVQNKGTDKAVETYQWDRFVSPSDTISMMRDAIAQGPKKLS
eukprot:Rhum_TRINITY_DN15056_c4_g1::Rhum_TRINITY_DN15056_c4_g1_i4::g.135332::m.135332